MAIKHLGILTLLASMLLAAILFYFTKDRVSSNPIIQAKQVGIADRGVGIVGGVYDDELVITSPLVIEGNVTDVELPKWNTPGEKTTTNLTGEDALYIDVKIHIDKVLKGTTESDSIVVRIYEEIYNDGKTIEGLLPDGKPIYSPNEKVIVFLDYDDSSYNQTKSKDYYVTRGMYQGKWTINGNEVSNSKKTKTKDELLKLIADHKDEYNPSQRMEGPDILH